MKKLLSLFLLGLVFSLTQNMASAQCTPDPNCTDPDGDGEFCPTEFPNAVEDEYYEQTITIISLSEVLGNPVHHIDLVSMGNIPPGMNYQCQNNNCSFYPATPKCVNVYGTPTIGSWGDYNLHMTIEVFIDIFGLPVSVGEVTDSSFVVTIEPKLHADFEVQYAFANIVCNNWGAFSVTYTGNATADATYNWNFGENVQVLSGSGMGPYMLEYSPDYFGYDSISLFVEEGPYTSPEHNDVFYVDICEGINEIDGNQIVAGPNPFTTDLNLSQLPAGNNHILIFDFSGKKVEEFQINDAQALLPLSHLNRGLYLLQVINSESSTTRKIIKQ